MSDPDPSKVERSHLHIEPGLSLDFLRRLYASTPDEGWLTLFHVDHYSGNRLVEWAPLASVYDEGESVRLAVRLADLAPRGDIWFGVAPRRERLGQGRRGGVKDCLSIPGLWLDIDVANAVHRLPGLPTSYEQARQLVLRFPLAPTLVVRSGYGLQVWWLFNEALPAEEAIPMLERWQVTWQRMAEQEHVHLDNTANLDRIMRLPGTLNFKGADPLAVTFKGRRNGV